MRQGLSGAEASRFSFDVLLPSLLLGGYMLWLQYVLVTSVLEI